MQLYRFPAKSITQGEKEMKKRFIGVLLVLCMVLSMVPVQALAEPGSNAGTDIAIDDVNFPDPGFREYVKIFDADHNSSFSQNEIAEITEIDCTYKNHQAAPNDQKISLLTGIENFVNLTRLTCSYNNLTSLDLSGNPALTYLQCDHNNLVSLDISKNPVLDEVDCSYNELESLDFSNNPMIKRITCDNNKFSSLNVSANKNLQHLYCTTGMDTKTPVTELDISGCTSLENIVANFNSVDISITIPQSGISCYLTLQVPNLFVVEWADCTDIAGREPDEAPNIIKFAENSDRITFNYKGQHHTFIKSETPAAVGIPVDSAHFPDINFRDYIAVWYSAAIDNVLTDEEISSIKSMMCRERGISDLTGIELFTALEGIDCSHNNLKSLDVSSNSALKDINCSHCALSALDISSNPALDRLYCDGNEFTTLDLSANAEWEELSADFDSKAMTLIIPKNGICFEASIWDSQCGPQVISYSTDLTGGKYDPDTRWITFDEGSNEITFDYVNRQDPHKQRLVKSERLDPVIPKATVTFSVENGTWNDNTSTDKTVEVSLTNGSGTLDAASVPSGMKPAEGFENGAWDVSPVTTEGGITGNVTYTYTFAPHVHTMEYHEEVYALCEKDGVKEHWHCTGCGKNFADEAGTQELTDLVIPATGHRWDENTRYKWSEDCTTCTAEQLCWNDCCHSRTAEAKITSEVTKEPTGTEMGQTTYTATFDEDWAETQTKTLTDIPAKGHVHAMEHHTEVSATCTEPGVKEYWHCTGCNKNFADEAGTQELTDLVIPATGHAWNAATYEWSEDGKTCTAKRVCQNNPDHFETANATVTSEVTKQPTETEMGQTTYTATFDVDWAETQIKVLTDGSVLPKQEYTILFNPMNGQAEFTTAATVNGKLEKLPECTRSGFAFGGWYDSAEGGNQVTLDHVYTEDTTLYARWVDENPMVYEYEVRFHANGSDQTVLVPADEAIGTRMPAEPVRDGYAFVEWNTRSDGTGETVTAETQVLQNIDVYAIWESNEQNHPITVQFIRKDWSGQHMTTVTLQERVSAKAPNANGFLQRGNCWYSEETGLKVASMGTISYAELLNALGGSAPEGAVVRFRSIRENTLPQPEPDEPADPQTQTVTVHFMENGQQIGKDVRVTISSDRSFVTAAQVAKHLPKGYDCAEAGQDYAIIDGVAEVPVKAVKPVEPIEKPITVTFKLGGWGSRLEGSRARTMTVTLEPGQSVKAPFAVTGFFGWARSIVWQSSTGLRVTSGDMVHYETLAQMLGDNTSITFTGR